MQKEWSSFRITLLLYILVLILPMSFYMVYESFKTIQNDTTIVSHSSKIGASMTYIVNEVNSQNLQQTISDIDSNLQNIATWVKQNDSSDLYIGAESLSQDFSQIKACWNNYKESLSTQETQMIREHALECWEKANDFAIVIEKMVYLKQNRMINLFYFALAVAMLLTLLIIYLVRVYIYQQMKKHAIYDHETKLFNKKYLLAELKISCARAVRNSNPLSILAISIDDLGKESKNYDQKTQEHILKIFGGLMTSLTRASDVACRYDEDHFFVLLPDTTRENALILEARVREKLGKHDFDVSPELNFVYTTTQFNEEETPESFVERSYK